MYCTKECALLHPMQQRRKGKKAIFFSWDIEKRSKDDDLLVPRKCLFLPVEFLLTLDALNRFWGRKRKMGKRINDAEMMWMWLLLLLRRLMPQGGGTFLWRKGLERRRVEQAA